MNISPEQTANQIADLLILKKHQSLILPDYCHGLTFRHMTKRHFLTEPRPLNFSKNYKSLNYH